MAEKKALLAGGCFWGMEYLFRKQPGIISTRVGYCGGETKDPTYPEVKTGETGHAETLEVLYNNDETTYQNILEFFFKMHDATTEGRQGNDIGSQYRSAIFYCDENQKNKALEIINYIDSLQILPGKIVTQVVPEAPFYEAEDYHQDYLENNPDGYTCHFVRKDWSLPKE
ncbi:MAG: peptide-methionine (S)-S-oxide reductase [Micavibrio sp.]|nr:peptide-methionine (S)-S-oxide reductase [Micavibrio sp.]HCK32588.1 peptide-methionine (S)-S-oxide reductase [Rhodospirillaceae bacterium]|tara:strand:- start:495 stop:1004 length:510 start_codon:yes stop_codon:yes gene_type:complete